MPREEFWVVVAHDGAALLRRVKRLKMIPKRWFYLFRSLLVLGSQRSCFLGMRRRKGDGGSTEMVESIHGKLALFLVADLGCPLPSTARGRA